MADNASCATGDVENASLAVLSAVYSNSTLFARLSNTVALKRCRLPSSLYTDPRWGSSVYASTSVSSL